MNRSIVYTLWAGFWYTYMDAPCMPFLLMVTAFCSTDSG